MIGHRTSGVRRESSSWYAASYAVIPPEAQRIMGLRYLREYVHGVVQGHTASRKSRLQVSKVIAAWAEKCSGPGWSNCVVWYLSRTDAGCLEINCLQPEEMSDAMHIMFNINNVVSRDMRCAVETLLWKNQNAEGIA